MAIDPQGNILSGDEDVLAVITKKTTREQLDELVRKLKERDMELVFDNIEYEEGKLVSISGRLKSKEARNNFVASDFNKLTLSKVHHNGRTHFKVSTTSVKVTI